MTLKFFILLIAILNFSSCLLVGDTKCCEKIETTEISKGIYLERYRIFCAGVFGELAECYLTDTLTFRTKVGSYDEHESFQVIQNGETIEAFNFQSSLLKDTIERKTISQKELFQIHHSDKNCLTTKPLFGINSLKCDTDYYPASSYKTEQGIYHTEIQFKCGNDYKNVIFYTDSLKFCIFVGLYEPGSFENNYSCSKIGSDNFEFYRVNYINKVDTVKRQTFVLSDLKKTKLFKVCKE
jgi:hypothetical protein